MSYIKSRLPKRGIVLFLLMLSLVLMAGSLHKPVSAQEGKMVPVRDQPTEAERQGGCVDDGFEDNDDFSQAYPLGPFVFIPDLQICSNDDDYFSFTLAPGDTVELNIYFIHSNGDLDMIFYDESQTELDRSQSITDNEQIIFTVNETGTYYLRVYGYLGAENAYELSLFTDQACVDDGFEENDNFNQATPLNLPVDEIDLAICSGDDDYYSFPLNAGDTVQIDIFFTHMDGDLDMRFYDESQTELDISQTITNNEQIIYTVNESGTYFVWVYGYEGAEVDYAIRVERVNNYTFLPVMMSPPAQEQVSFAVIGDYGTPGEAEAAVASLVNSWNVDFVTTVGDNRYNNPGYDAAVGQYYCNFLTDAVAGAFCNGGNSLQNAFFPSTGNHDYNNGGGINEYLSYFTLPGVGIDTLGTSGSERYYDVRSGIVHLFILDSQGAQQAADRTVQQNWLQTALASSTARWKFIFLHHAPYSSANHGSQAYMQWPYGDWGASAVFAGHDHVYERLQIGELPYFVNGLGGAGIYEFNSPIAGSQVRYNADHGAMQMRVTNSSVQVKFINRDGIQIDDYTWSN